MSPFIVTTTRSCNCEPSTCESDGLLYHETRCSVFKVPRSERGDRHAVATLEGQPGIADARKAEHMAARPQGLGYTLPDGTTIQVESVCWYDLARAAGLDLVAYITDLSSHLVQRHDQALAAFNAKHGPDPSKCGSSDSAEAEREAAGLPNPKPEGGES